MVREHILEPENRMRVRKQVVEEALGPREELDYGAGSQRRPVDGVPA